MTRLTTILATALLAATFASAQTTTSPAQSASDAAPQTPRASSQTSGAEATPATGSHRILQAKSKEEMDAYNNAQVIAEPAKAEAAANDFAAKYPTSELSASLYMRVMSLYGQANNTEKVIVTGRQAIAADPTNPIPLVQVASALAESTRDTDLDREQRLAEAAKDAQAAIDNLDTGLLVPPNADPARVEAAKHSILTMAYDTLGMVNLNRNDYAAAATTCKRLSTKAAEIPKECFTCVFQWPRTSCSSFRRLWILPTKPCSTHRQAVRQWLWRSNSRLVYKS